MLSRSEGQQACKQVLRSVQPLKGLTTTLFNTPLSGAFEVNQKQRKHWSKEKKNLYYQKQNKVQRGNSEYHAKYQ